MVHYLYFNVLSSHKWLPPFNCPDVQTCGLLKDHIQPVMRSDMIAEKLLALIFCQPGAVMFIDVALNMLPSHVIFLFSENYYRRKALNTMVS